MFNFKHSLLLRVSCKVWSSGTLLIAWWLHLAWNIYIYSEFNARCNLHAKFFAWKLHLVWNSVADSLHVLDTIYYSIIYNIGETKLLICGKSNRVVAFDLDLLVKPLSFYKAKLVGLVIFSNRTQYFWALELGWTGKFVPNREEVCSDQSDMPWSC